jgi:hypothetical protein
LARILPNVHSGNGNAARGLTKLAAFLAGRLTWVVMGFANEVALGKK